MKGILRDLGQEQGQKWPYCSESTITGYKNDVKPYEECIIVVLQQSFLLQYWIQHKGKCGDFEDWNGL